MCFGGVFYLLLATSLSSCEAVVYELGYYGADSNQVSVSGLSSGAYMTVQMHVSHSETFMGAGVVAGGPFYCAQFSALKATGECMKEPDNINVGYLQWVTENAAALFYIDRVENMRSDKVYLFSGKEDSVVVQGVMEKLFDYYASFVDTANIKKQFSIPAGHAFVSERVGNPCSANEEPFIDDCNSDEAYNILNHIYGGNLIKPGINDGFNSANLYEFDQTEFTTYSCKMDTTGYIYVPDACNRRFSNCKVHVVFHGCLQGKEQVTDLVPQYTGYNEVAELNDIIVIYPQAVTSQLNPNGCWDWWGYTGPAYACKLGNQVKAIKAMVDRVLS